MSRKFKSIGKKTSVFCVAVLTLLGISLNPLMEAHAVKPQTPGTFRLRSEAFLSGGALPRRHTGEGEDISPSLRWENAPEKALEFALIVDDPDAPGGTPWVHWILYKIASDEPGIPENIPSALKLEEPHDSLQGVNSWGSIGYRGPLPPKGSGIHHYRFSLYALDKELTLPPGVEKSALLKAMTGHVLSTAELVGVYGR